MQLYITSPRPELPGSMRNGGEWAGIRDGRSAVRRGLPAKE